MTNIQSCFRTVCKMKKKKQSAEAEKLLLHFMGEHPSVFDLSGEERVLFGKLADKVLSHNKEWKRLPFAQWYELLLQKNP